MYWERITEEIYLFTSDRYALVNSTAILTKEGIVIIDALPFPDEAKQIARFLELRAPEGFHSIILTHHHVDHVYGLFAFPRHLEVISHELCRQILAETGEASLIEARKNSPVFDEVELRIPTISFDTGEMFLRAGEKTFRLFHLPGHTPDNIGVLYEEQQILFTGDAVMAIPIIADGNYEQELASLRRIKELAPETLVQGHGEVILRGEVQIVLDRYLRYLERMYKKAAGVFENGREREALWKIPLEDCGLERVPLGIASHQLHVANMMRVYDQLKAEQEGKTSEADTL
ncbi:MAG: MBL fold metallo-hydrolase [Anaerolineae bacterium]|nr:MBL fold metallo-hydrolase [Anaerolineae bacterium]